MKPRYIPVGNGLYRASAESVKAILRHRGLHQIDVAKKLVTSNTYVWSVVHGHVRSSRIEDELSQLIGMPLVLDLNVKTPGALALAALEAQLKKQGKTLMEWAVVNGFTRDNISWLRTGKSQAIAGNAKRLSQLLGLPTGQRKPAKKAKPQS